MTEPQARDGPILGRLCLEYDHADAAEMLEGRFSRYLDPATDEDLKAAYDHDRYLFDAFPALTIEEIGAAGSPAKSGRLPERMLFNVRVYHPSLYGSLMGDTFAVQRDARAEAKRFTRRILGRWEKALADDKRLRLSVDNVSPLEWEYGDADRLGNLRISGTGDSVLWVARLALEIRP